VLQVTFAQVFVEVAGSASELSNVQLANLPSFAAAERSNVFRSFVHNTRDHGFARRLVSEPGVSGQNRLSRALLYADIYPVAVTYLTRYAAGRRRSFAQTSLSNFLGALRQCNYRPTTCATLDNSRTRPVAAAYNGKQKRDA